MAVKTHRPPDRTVTAKIATCLGEGGHPLQKNAHRSRGLVPPVYLQSVWVPFPCL